MRIYYPRLGRFLSVDPLTTSYPSWSPYPFAMNIPIRLIDVEGAGPGDPMKKVAVETVTKGVDIAVKPVIKIVWKQTTEEIAETMVKKIVWGITVKGLLARSDFWLYVIDFFGSGTDSPQLLASENYQKYVAAGREEEFWQRWAGPDKNYPLPLDEVGDELTIWLQKYWPENLSINIVGTQEHHFIPNAFIDSKTQTKECFQSAFPDDLGKKRGNREFDESWNMIKLTNSLHNGYHPNCNKLVSYLWDNYWANKFPLEDCGTDYSKNYIKAFAKYTMDDIKRRINDPNNKGKTLNEIYGEALEQIVH